MNQKENLGTSFSYFDAFLLLEKDLCSWTTFLGLGFHIWEITVYLLRSHPNLRLNTFDRKGSCQDLGRKKPLCSTAHTETVHQYYLVQKWQTLLKFDKFSSLNVLGIAGFCLKIFILASHSLNCNAKSFLMNDYKGKFAWCISFLFFSILFIPLEKIFWQVLGYNCQKSVLPSATSESLPLFMEQQLWRVGSCLSFFFFLTAHDKCLQELM